MTVKCLIQDHKTVPYPGLEPKPLHLESIALIISLPRLPQTGVGR